KLDSLAFLPENEVPIRGNGFFKNNYATGGNRFSQGRIRVFAAHRLKKILHLIYIGFSLYSLSGNTALDLVDYFDTTHVHGSYRSVQYNPNNGIRLQNIAPLYPPSIWNVYQTTLDNGHRTNNETEGWNHKYLYYNIDICGWNHRFSKLVGHNHPSIWTLIKKIRLVRLELSFDET
ncbi:FLYWCH-type domain-containing protein, partial [Aphis craccivora]